MPLTVLSVGYPLAKVSPATPGGAEQVLLTLDKALVRAGHRSIVLAPAGSHCRGLLVPVTVPKGELDEAAKRGAQRSFKQALDRVLQQFPVDVVHMHGLDFHAYLPRADVPVVVTLHLPLSWYEARALREVRSNVALVCVSQAQARTAPPGVHISYTISNGIDLEDFEPAQHKRNYAVVMGRICPEKATHVAIDAAERAGIDVMIAGTAYGYREHQSYFESMIRPKLGARVRFLGPIGGRRKAQLLAGARCLLIPSLAPETSSLASMEALACGTPVIAWRSGALPEIIEHGKTGFIVSSLQEMAEAIQKVGAISPVECRSEACRRFSSVQMSSGYFQLYEQMIGEALWSEPVAA